jgi:hypothetical protein
MKMRKGWVVTWPDGTTWHGDCPRWAAQALMPGATLRPARILAAVKPRCNVCPDGRRH